jgi:rRNA maturation RNase YbeY
MFFIGRENNSCTSMLRQFAENRAKEYDSAVHIVLMKTKTYFRGPMAIFFHSADINPQIKQKIALKRWISDQVLSENLSVGTINIIICSDDFLLDINRKHLQHDYFTDIITFDYSQGKLISGDLYISYERIIDNAKTFATSHANELHRVIIHGVMHLCGYKDKKKSDAVLMRQKEDISLQKIKNYVSN